MPVSVDTSPTTLTGSRCLWRCDVVEIEEVLMDRVLLVISILLLLAAAFKVQLGAIEPGWLGLALFVLTQLL